MVIKYDDLYRVSEELQQLVEAPLQNVHAISDLRYALGFRVPHETVWVVIDLTPSQPFIVSTSLTKLKGAKVVTPVLNFLKAHFVGKILKQVEIAQKPNRTLKMCFSEASVVTFKCFPHGQHLLLEASGKIVNAPLRPKPLEPEPVTFIETEKQTGWEFNRFLSGQLGLGAAPGDDPAPRGAPAEPANSYRSQLIRKLEKSIASLDKGVEKSAAADDAKIAELRTEAQKLQGSGKAAGSQIQGVFDEIKKLKRKALLSATRRNELLAQLEKIKKLPEDFERPVMSSKSRRSDNRFSGTRIHLDSTFELWVGRTDWQNDDLLRLASAHELWLHLRDYPGAHGVIRCPKKVSPTPAQIEFSCRVVAILSAKKKNPFAEGEALDFIVTPRKFVKKPKGAAPGRVVVERESVRRVAYKTIKFEVI